MKRLRPQASAQQPVAPKLGRVAPSEGGRGFAPSEERK